MRKPIAGYRYFKCPECKREWKEATRDCKSPSKVCCHNYDKHEMELPVEVESYKNEVDKTLLTDDSGNLI